MVYLIRKNENINKDYFYNRYNTYKKIISFFKNNFSKHLLTNELFLKKFSNDSLLEKRKLFLKDKLIPKVKDEKNDYFSNMEEKIIKKTPRNYYLFFKGYFFLKNNFKKKYNFQDISYVKFKNSKFFLKDFYHNIKKNVYNIFFYMSVMNNICNLLSNNNSKFNYWVRKNFIFKLRSSFLNIKKLIFNSKLINLLKINSNNSLLLLINKFIYLNNKYKFLFLKHKKINKYGTFSFLKLFSFLKKKLYKEKNINNNFIIKKNKDVYYLK